MESEFKQWLAAAGEAAKALIKFTEEGRGEGKGRGDRAEVTR